MEAITWTCHVCGEERPDAVIGVFQHHVTKGRVEMQVNVRYCTDRAACRAGAEHGPNHMSSMIWPTPPMHHAVDLIERERVADAATGQPPLGEVEPDIAIFVLAWTGSVGVVASPISTEPTAVRYLSARGLVTPLDGGPPDWAQVHIAVPAQHAAAVAELLAPTADG